MSSSSDSSLSASLTTFVEAHTGPLRSVRRSEGGASRITWLLDTERGPAVLRQDAGDGPVAHTPLTLAREATVYRALSGTRVRIPRLIAETGDALLMEMAPGTPDLDGLDAARKVRILDDYVDAIADLHQIQVTDQFQPLDPPPTPTEAATRLVNLWRGILESRVRRASPLAEFAGRWLSANAPASAKRLVVCHGDVGPGNFLHDGNRVTALLDWEFVHVGDPMDDLAWLAFRGHHFSGDMGDFDAQLERWQTHTGFEVDRRRIAYYRVGVMYIWLVSCLAALDNGATNQDRFTYLNLINLMNVILPRAIMTFDGHPIPKIEVDLPARHTELSEQLAALIDLLAIRWDGDPGNHMYVAMMAQQIQRFSELEQAVGEQNAVAVSRHIGQTVGPGDAGSAFADWIIRHGPTDTTVEVLYANGLRRIQSDAAIRPVADRPFLELT